RRSAFRRAASRRHRPRARPDLRDRRRGDVAPRRDRLPEDHLGHRSHDAGAGPRAAGAARRARARPAARPRRGASREPEQLVVTAASGAALTRIWIGPGLLDAAGERLFSPSGRFLIVAPAAAAGARDRVARALAGRILADVPLDDREEAKTLAAVS